jgi:hypothetical protein
VTVIVIVIVLRILCYDTIVLNVHEPTGNKSTDSKEMSCEKLEQVFNFFPRQHTEFC